MKRADYISWDQYFMGIAMMSAERSKRSVYAGWGMYSR